MNLTPRPILGILAAAVSACAVLHIAGCTSAPKPQGREAAIDSYVQGVLAYNAGNQDKAMAELKDAVKQHGNLTMAHAMLGDLYKNKKDYNEALAQYQITTQLDPYSSKNYYNQGLMFHLLNRLEDAVASYLRALKLNPKDFDSNLGLSGAYLTLHQPDDALSYARRATELNGKSAAAWTNLAVALDAKKEYRDAETAYRRALESDSSRVEIAVALAENLMHQQQYAEARSVMGQVVQISDTAPHHKRLGDTLFLEKKYEEAVNEYARALRLDSHYFPALNATGSVLITEYRQSLGLEENKRDAALDSWRKSLLINPNQPQITQLMKAYSEKFSDER